MSAIYYIAKGQKTLGPCTLDDLRSFLAYGSIEKGDLVMRDGEELWRPVASLLSSAGDEASAPDQLALNAPLRRRTVRYRDYERVPTEQRAGQVVKWIALGFLFFPPLLWRGAVSVYSHRIFRSVPNEDGYLKIWPKRVDVPVTLLILVNAVLWWVLLAWVTQFFGPIARDLMEALRTVMAGVGELFG